MKGITTCVVHLDNNEAAFSIAVVPFSAQNNELLLVVGTAADTFVAPRSCKHGYLRLYRFSEDGKTISFLHKVCQTSLEVIHQAEGRVIDRSRRCTAGAPRFPGPFTGGSRECASHLRDWEEEATSKMRKQGPEFPNCV